MPRLTKVQQNEMAVVEIVTGKEILYTVGVSTCVCLAVKGQYGAHPFLALLHWDGFNLNFDKHAPALEDRAFIEIDLLMRRFVTTIKNSFAASQRFERPELNYIFLIGGEKRASNLSGTELEVEILKKYLPILCGKYFSVWSNTLFEYRNYLTDGAQCQTVNVIMRPSGIEFEFDSFGYIDEIESKKRHSDSSTHPPSEDDSVDPDDKSLFKPK